jgi:hypothetical protein
MFARRPEARSSDGLGLGLGRREGDAVDAGVDGPTDVAGGTDEGAVEPQPEARLTMIIALAILPSRSIFRPRSCIVIAPRVAGFRR